MGTSKGAALITGGARRIGKALALRLAEEGYDIALHYHRSAQEAKAVIKVIEATGRQCRLYPCDLEDFAALKPMINQVFKDFPRCNLLVHNASVFERFAFEETDEAIFDRHISVNFKAPFFLTQYFAAQCEEGQVVNILDSYTSKNQSPYFIYLLSKKALHAFTKMAAVVLGPKIRVNGVAPGLTELSNDEDQAFLERKKRLLPLRHIVKVDDIVAAVVQLLEAEYITGQVLNVDGGEHLL